MGRAAAQRFARQPLDLLESAGELRDEDAALARG
jgi:hypothetical protein